MFNNDSALRLAYNIALREGKITTTTPGGSKIPVDAVKEKFYKLMDEEYSNLYSKYVPKSGEAYLQTEGYQRGKSQRTEESKKKVSKETVRFIKEQYRATEELLALPKKTNEVNEYKDLSLSEKAEALLKLKNYEANYDWTRPTARKWKADMEVARSRLLNSSKVPLEIRRYLAKGTLQDVQDYIDFMAEAKERAENAENSFYQEMMETWYSTEQMAQSYPISANTRDRKIFYNFIRHQIENAFDMNEAEKFRNRAAKIKVRGKNVFTYDDFIGYGDLDKE